MITEARSLGYEERDQLSDRVAAALIREGVATGGQLNPGDTPLRPAGDGRPSRHHARRRLSARLLLLALSAGLFGCRTDGMLFNQDSLVKIDTPAPNSEVSLPVRLRWTTNSRPAGAASYAVFVDQAPIRPGRTLRDLADDACKHRAGCPDATYLEDRQVYVVQGNALLLSTIVDRQARTGVPDIHEATIIFLDRAGKRVGEHFYSVEFTLRHSTGGSHAG